MELKPQTDFIYYISIAASILFGATFHATKKYRENRMKRWKGEKAYPYTGVDFFTLLVVSSFTGFLAMLIIISVIEIFRPEAAYAIAGDWTVRLSVVGGIAAAAAAAGIEGMNWVSGRLAKLVDKLLIAYLEKK